MCDGDISGSQSHLTVLLQHEGENLLEPHRLDGGVKDEATRHIPPLLGVAGDDRVVVDGAAVHTYYSRVLLTESKGWLLPQLTLVSESLTWVTRSV